MLIQNPSIRKYRGHYIRRHIPVKHLTRALFMQFHSGKELEGETHVDIDDVRAASIGYQYREGLYNESSELTTSEKFKQWLQFEKFWKHHNDETNDDNESESSSSDSPMCKMNDNFKRFLKFMKYRDRSSSNGSSNSSTDQKVESSDDKKMTKSVTETSVINNDEKIETSKNAESPDSSSEENSRNVINVSSPTREQRHADEFNIEMGDIGTNDSNNLEGQFNQDPDQWV